MLDVHTHINDDKLFVIKDEIINNLGNHNISKVIVPSCDRVMNERAVELIGYPCVFAALGIHPSNADDWTIDIKNLMNEYHNHPKVVAIGEIGLDLHYPESDLYKQRQVFLEQLKLAKDFCLPVILHLRDAWNEFFEFLNEYRELFCNGVDVHCFDGDKTIAKKLLDEGFYISLTSMSVGDRPKYREMVQYLPLDRFMVETDSPYLLPHEYKGKEAYNTPKNVNYVAECVAKYKGITIQDVDRYTTKNAYRLFKKLGENNAG